MPIIFVKSHYPVHKNKEVLTTWFKAIEKHPRPEGLFTTMIDTAISSDKKGIKVLSAYLTNPGKYEDASAYLHKFTAEFMEIEGFGYEFSTWSTIEEAMESIGQQMPKR